MSDQPIKVFSVMDGSSLSRMQPSTSSNQSCMMKYFAGGVVALGTLAYCLHRFNSKVRLGSAIWSRSWFSEFSSMWPGQAFSLRVEKTLFDGKSDFQHVQVFDCGSVWGRVLVLDGVIQVTEKDECAYQEMMAHVPLLSHPAPKRVLVIGGGDGGVLREISKHPAVEEIHICELDQLVIDMSKKHLPSLSIGYSDPRVQVHVMDGVEFIKSRIHYFDVIIVDSSDPIGPADVLFKEPFYKACAEALTTDGILCCQGECMWLHTDVITGIIKFAGSIFQSVEYGWISMPSYPCGTIGLICCSKNKDFKCSSPAVTSHVAIDKCKYYNLDIHKAAFVLPTFVSKAIHQ